jgi:hypothetical protein
MTIIGTPHFVNFTKACDYYRDYVPSRTPAELERNVRAKIAEGEISLGKPDVQVGERLLLIDNGTRYAIERED